MSTALRSTIEHLFQALEAKDLEAALGYMADDAILIDPHYPVARMVGKVAIADGLRWAFKSLRSLSFPVVGYCEAVNGHQATVEVDAVHVAQVGVTLRVPQVFAIETRDGMVIRVRAYTSHGPGGVGGVILGMTRIVRRIQQIRAGRAKG